MPCDRYEHLRSEGARATASNPAGRWDDAHSMPAISGRALEAHLRHCDACQADGRNPNDARSLRF